jgi:Bifunctional DNA primase/polymerase, N-terminal
MTNESGNSAFLSLFQPGADFRDAALAYASYQLFVHPLVPGEKRALVKAWQRHATTDYDQIKEWWSEDSEHNIGIYLPPSCIVVIDVDPRNGGDESFDRMVRSYGALPSTYTVSTASEGRHYYFRVTPDFYESDIHYPNKLADGVELLINKYVVAPPSRLNTGGEYTVANASFDHARPVFTLLPDDWIQSAIKDRALIFDPEDSWHNGEEDWVLKQGKRNTGMTQIAGYLRRCAFSPKEIEKFLHILGQEGRIEDYGTDLELNHEISTVSRSAARWRPEFNVNQISVTVKRKRQKPELDSAALYGPLGEFVRYLQPITEAHPAALLGQSLAVFGNLIGGKDQDDPGPGFTVEDSHHKTALYVMIVGESAQAGKGDSWARVHNLFKNVDPSWRSRSGIQTGEAIIDQLADVEVSQNGEYLRDGKQAVDKRFLVYEPEFARVLHVAHRQGSIVKDILRSLWDTGETESIAKSSHQRVTNGTLSIVGHITKADMENDMEAVDLVNGFGNRFLYVHSERTQYLPSAQSLSKSDIRKLTQPFRYALKFSQGYNCPAEYQFTKEAGALFEDLGRQWYYEGKRPSPNIEDQLAARARPQVRRMAIIYAVADCSDIIELEHMEAAYAFWQYCNDSVAWIFADRIGDPDADKLYRALLEHPAGLTPIEINHDVFKKNVSAARIQRALRMLAERNLLIKQTIKKDRKTSDLYMARPQ